MADEKEISEKLKGKDTSISAQIQELKRELALRKNVYPNQIKKGKMNQDEANYHYYLIKKSIDSLERYQAIKYVVNDMSKSELKENKNEDT